ncbi:hypothetical protein C1637_22440 [Chryseobacterium lactis]|uniref:Uncharacterized protein n=1 Tax=Chryseobacterium lactis TaxID=1241981 RepID=A0A3G6RQV8_CHRLC|nr:hypothetical protein [Chryseobacterium lactis]AZA80425.1 hypothetical protein EG342_00155 [Chryseobacterium lactis]AZB05427.1 hypothetical protein EG341_16280 [Chryseobacterium lactis]PNW11576.1 hypothetical protein C1637_22440 [Chryseobacterium lactis]
MAKNTKQSSEEVAHLASTVLTDHNSSATAKKLAGSVLSQTNSDNQTGKEMETLASSVLQSSKYSEQTKTLAASVLSQSNKKR